MASPLKKEPSERIYMEEDQSPYTPALGHPGYGQTLSEPETPSNSGSEDEGNRIGRNFSGILSGGRPVRLVLYDRHQVDNTRTIWIDFESTYSDVANELTEIAANRTFIILQPIWGSLPYWIEANPDSLIGTACQTLYIVLESESVGYILGVVRTSLSDYPIAIFEGPLDPSATVSEAVVASHPKLSGQIKSITSFTDNQIIQDTQGGYDSLRQYSSSRAPVVIMTVDEAPTQFMSDLSDGSIPPLLQVSFADCKCLMQRGHDQDFFALQIIHLLRAILHTIISLALKMEKFFEDDAPDIETALHAEDDIADFLRVAPLLSHELQTLLRKLNGIIETLGGGRFDTDDIQKKLDNAFYAVCADYPGAVTTRRSYGLFKRLRRIDHEEIQISLPRDVAGQPVPNSNVRHRFPKDHTWTQKVEPHPPPPASPASSQAAPSVPRTFQTHTQKVDPHPPPPAGPAPSQVTHIATAPSIGQNRTQKVDPRSPSSASPVSFQAAPSVPQTRQTHTQKFDHRLPPPTGNTPVGPATAVPPIDQTRTRKVDPHPPRPAGPASFQASPIVLPDDLDDLDDVLPPIDPRTWPTDFHDDLDDIDDIDDILRSIDRTRTRTRPIVFHDDLDDIIPPFGHTRTRKVYPHSPRPVSPVSLQAAPSIPLKDHTRTQKVEPRLPSPAGNTPVGPAPAVPPINQTRTQKADPHPPPPVGPGSSQAAPIVPLTPQTQAHEVDTPKIGIIRKIVNQGREMIGRTRNG